MIKGLPFTKKHKSWTSFPTYSNGMIYHSYDIYSNNKLLITELAREPPEIQGGRGNYFYGDDLNLNCTSKPTYPPTTLTW